MPSFKVKCIKLPDERCTTKDITIGNIYRVMWADADDFKLEHDDKGNERYYRPECFEIVNFETITTFEITHPRKEITNKE